MMRNASGSVPPGNNNNVNVSVCDFLAAVFGPDLPNAWVCVVPNADSPDWAGASASKAQFDGPGWDAQNCYYSVAVLKPGATSRKDVNWSHTRVIVVDDVVEKADAGHVCGILGYPSFIVQTSPGSQQWGYILKEPVTDPAVQARLMRAITLAFFKGIEPGHRDLTRYVRLPVGINNKASRVAANGGTPPEVSCVWWEPTLPHTWQDLAQNLDAVDSALTPGTSAWQDAEGAKVISASASGVMGRYARVTLADVDTWIAKGDYVLAAFRELGMLKGDQDNGYYEVECPWDATHTKHDDRTGWSPERFLGNAKGFKCHHSDGVGVEGRTDTEVAGELASRLPVGRFDTLANVSRQTRKAAGVSAFAASPPSPGQAGMLVVAQAVASATGAPRTWRRVGRGAPARALPARADVSSLLTRGTVTLFVSQPNVGKSQAAVLKACALAAERHDIFGEENTFAHTGGVVFIGNEDDADEFERRRNACLKANNVSVADLKHDIIVNEQPGFRAVCKSGGAIELAPEMQRLAADIRAWRAMGDDFAVIIIDTQASSFSGLDENSNSDMAAAGALLAGFAQYLDVALMLIHHTTKDSWRSGSTGMDAARGASGMSASVRCIAMLVPPTPAEEESLPEDQRRGWFRVVVTKKSYSRFPPDRWFRKVGVVLPTAAPAGSPGAAPGIAPGDSAPACVYDAKGPKLGLDTSDDDRVFRSIEAIMSKVDAGEHVRAGATGTGTKGRDVIAVAIECDSAAGAKMQKALLARGLLEEIEEHVRGRRGQTRMVLKPTDAGREFVKKRQAVASILDAGMNADSDEAKGLAEPAAPREAGAGVLATVGEINF